MPSDATVAPAPAAFRLPLSEAQRDIWTAHTLDPTGLKYNVAECRDILGPVDPALMGAAWRRLVEEADVMRTRRFEDDGEQVWQLIDAEAGDRTLPYTDVSGEADPEGAAWASVDAAIGAPFDLTRESPVRCALIKLADDRYFYFYGFHHLLVDGASVSMLLHRLVELYEHAVAGEPWGDSPFGRLADLHAEDAAYRCSEEASAERAAWREHLSGAPETAQGLVRGAGRAAPSRGVLPFARRTVLIPAEDADRLRTVARSERVSWPVLTVALFTVYLHRVTAQDELVLALPVAGRTTKTARSTPGMASNVVPLRLRVGADDTLRTLVRAVSAEVKHGLRHQLTRYETLRRDAGTLTGGRRLTGPVLNLMGFNADLTVCGHPTVNHNVSNGPVDDLSVAVYDLGAADGLRIDFDTPVDGVDAEATAAHQDRFAAFLTTSLDAAEPGDRSVAELEVLSRGERELLLGPWAGAVAGRDDVSLVARFEEQVARFPDAVALIEGERGFTYAELNATANRWAHHLSSQGLGRGDLAGILLERDATFATALIAVLKTGAGHVLLDPDFPDERLRSAATEAAISHLVTRAGLADRLAGAWTTCTEGPGDVAEHDSGNLDVPIRGDDLACVMFTSGSTGRPKGILSSHRNLVSTLVGQTYLPTGPDEVFLQSSPVSWDAFSLEFWGPLLHGACVVLQPGQKPEPALISELAPKHRVTTLLLSASLFNYLVDEHPETFDSVTTAYTVGEAASPAHVHKLQTARPGIKVINGYGPAEAMIYATTHTIEPSDAPHTAIPIGTPLVNKPLYVLDAALRLCPPGATGELYVSGDGLAHGYLNRSDLTAASFVPHPYGPAGSRLYRTGDLAHFDHDGRLHYEGRADHQIKIRGFRIEPAEVETALLGHPQVTQAVVTKHHDQLSAYVVTTGDAVSMPELRRHLVDRLPEHLVPAHLTPLDRLPLTANGKIDKRALPEPVAVPSGGRAPRTLLEETLTGLFTSTLDAPGPLTIDDDFFHHGGHSILAARLTNRIAPVLGVRLTIRDVFENPTVARLAEKVSTEKGLPALPPLSAGEGPGEGSAPMSFAQRRLWLLADLEGGSTAYNVPMTVRLEGALDADALEAALNDVIERHAPLRTLYETVDGEPRQRVLPAAEARVVVDRREVTAEELDGAMAEAGRHTFDLHSELPLTVSLFRTDATAHHLVIVLHHIATDGQSSEVYVTDLARAYEARLAGAERPVLEPLSVQYADYAVWQQRVLGSSDDAESVLSQELDFWRGALAELPEEHGLNLDRPRPARASHRGGQVDVELGDDLFARIGELARAEGCTPFMVVHAALAAALTRLGAGTDLAIGSPVAGRTDEALRDLVGFFVNTLVLRTHTDGNPTFRELLERVRSADLDAFAHQDAPFDLVLDALNPTRTLSRHPLFQICLTLETSTPVLALSGVRPEAVRTFTNGSAKFDLEFLLRTDDGEGLRGLVVFEEDLFDRSTVQRMVTVLGEVLRQVLTDPGVRLGEVEVLSEAERELLLGSWAGAVAGRDDVSLVQRFEEQVERFPDAVALVDGERRLTYAELNATANRWARGLRSRGLGRGDLAGILLERDATFATALIAVLKTGAGHVLLDPDFPDERLRSAADEAAISHLVTGPEPAGRLSGAWITCTEGPDGFTDHDSGNLGVPIGGDDLACVMFTSGSTGRPKGILSSHRNLVSTLVGQTYLPTSPDEVFLQSSPVSWDAFSLEFWGPLLHGATAVLQPGQKPEPALIAELAPKHRVTTLLLSASLFNYLVDEHPETFDSVTTAYTVGEAASPAHVHKLQTARPGIKVINGYGPAEAMIYATTHTIEPSDAPHTAIPIGTPLVNKPLYVLDAALRLCPPGATGELYVSGDGLAHGYLNRSDLTAASFVPHPYGPAGSRLYRTGDLAHFDHDGRLHYEGRADHQIKIRGFRIEPAEVEAALLAHDGVTQAVVTRHHDQLSAYVVTTGDAVSMPELRRHLVDRLPEHLVPAHLTPLDRLPLTANGKIDKRALPEPVALVGSERAPQSQLEEVAVALFSKVLGTPGPVGVEDSFFAHGGHSLLAARLTNHLAEVLGVRLTIRDVFQHPTPARLAQYIASLKGRPALPPLVAGEAGDGCDSPVSFAQRRLWLLAELDGGSTAYNVPMAVRLTSPPDADALEAALNDVIERHAPLRTVFATVGGEPRQLVQPAEQARVTVERRTSTQETLDGDLDAAGRHRFDLRTENPLRATLFEVGDGHTVLFLLFQHIATDGRSAGVFFDDLSRAYEARSAGSTVSVLEPLPVQYADYAVWQQRVLGSSDDTDSVLSQELAFWQGALAELPEEHGLSLDRPRPAVASHRGGQVEVALDDDLFERVGELARAEGCTPFMVMHAALAAALTRLGAGTDLAIGSPVAGRTDEALRDLVGFFVNTLVLRTHTDGNPTFRELLERVRSADLDAFAHQDAPFDLVLDALNPARTLSRHPLFQICLTLEAGEAPALDLGGGRTAEVRGLTNGSAKFDLEFLLRSDDSRRLHGAVVFAEDLFDHATVQRMVTVLGEVLRQAVADPEVRLGALEVVSDAERELLLGPWAGTTAAIEDASLVARFEDQVARTPEAVALIDGDQRITYEELNAAANRWAHELRARGLGRGGLAGVLLERGATFAATVIAVVKAGAGYTLLDPDFPDERLRSAAHDAGITLLLTDDALAPRVEGPWAVVSCSGGAPADMADGNPGVLVRGDDVACVMFTSGSTGRPKGILSSHRNLVSTVTAQTYGNFGPDEVFLQCSPVSWDAFSLEFWGALLHGGTTVIQPGQKPEPALIAELSRRHGVTMLQLSASLFNYLTDEHPEAFESVTVAYTGGEAASPNHVHKLQQLSPHTTVTNGYGPAESMGFTTTHTITAAAEPHSTIAIGTPLTNKAAYILDTTLQPVPPGVTGHLYLTGHGLAHGYLNRPDLTATTFIPNPHGTPGTRLYRTGDLAHFDQHGHLHYNGRADNQVKIRGFRIEPGEIEAALLTHPHITQATVTTHHDQLSAYVVLGTATVTTEDIRRHLVERLPEHMVPAHLTVLDRLPLTPNGKIDRRALPEPATVVSQGRAPRSQLEEVAVALFSKVLGTPGPVGVEDSFFAHGGHSLLAARLTNHLADVLGVRLTIRDVFQHPTPAHLARHIATLDGRPALPPLTAGAWTGDGDAPVSFAQRRLWLLAELDGGSAAYNVPMAVRLTGHLDAELLEAALHDVVARHAPLRTVFTTVDGAPRQHVLPVTDARVPVERREVTSDGLDEAMAGAARHVFDLGSELPLRASLFKVDDRSWVFFLLVHHIATDGRSTGVFFDDLSLAYEARVAGSTVSVLEPLPVEYADYAVWQQRVLGASDDADSVLSQELAFWHKTLEGLPEEHALNLDRPRPARASHRGGQVEVALGDDLFERVGELARAEGCTPFMVVHAALAAALTRLGAGTDLAIGSPVAGRTDEALRDLVGFFVNTLVLRTHTDGNPTFRELLERVRSADLDAFAHQDAPFDLVLDALNPTRTLSRHPLFQICLTLETEGVPELRLGDARVTAVPEVTSGAAKFDLEFLLRTDNGQGLHGTVLFAEDLFDRSTVQRVVTVLSTVLRQAVADPEVRLGALEVVSDAERELLLGPWAGTTAAIEDASLVARFEDQVARTPEAVALIDGDQRITYEELNAAANRWAHQLRARGLGRGDLAGILLERDATFATALIAVLKTGAGHVLLDPDFPDERLRSAATEAAISHLVTRPELAGRLPGTWTTCTEGPDDVAHHEAGNLGTPIRAQDVACVMFTSGSTGRPKGILSSHRNLVSTVTAQTYGNFGPDEVFLQCSPVSWDAFSLEFWGALLHGGTTVLQPGQKPEPALITELSRRHGVTMLQLSASLFNYLTDEHPEAFTTVTIAYTGGEAASPNHVHKLQQLSPHTTVTNGYGPAESMGFTTTHTITAAAEPHSTIAIGTPLTNKGAYILDTTLQPVPPGVTGHLYLTGHGLAHGYLNRPDLTATTFIPNPHGTPGTRLYRTGDLAHFDQHGHLHYNGRADNQVKIRGFRIEPGEIEAALLTHPHITQATVTTHHDQLSAYVVLGTATVTTEDIRRHLVERLPEHMVPTYLTVLDRLPLTPNGKIDRRALPEPATVVSQGRAPRNPLEETLVGLFTRTLGAENALSIDDDFFHHGGHSLLGARLTNHIAVSLDVRLTVRDVFEHPTPARLAEHITALKTAPAAKKARPALRRRTETERISS